MIIEDFTVLRSLRNEAERQSEFYASRGQAHLSEFWSDLAAQSQLALQSPGQRWSLILSSSIENPIPIKAGEQHQQPSNNKVIKAFQ